MSTEPGLAHTALIASSDTELLSILVPELRRSTERYDETLLVVREHTRTVLGEQVGALESAALGEPAEFYQRLGFAYEGFRRYLAAQQDAGRRVHLLAEPDLTGATDAGLQADRAAAYLAYEAVCNQTYAPYGSAITCLWNPQHHPRPVLDGVRATHPYLLTPTGPVRSPTYLAPQRYLSERQDMPWRPAPAHIDHELVLSEVAGLSRLRTVLHTWAIEHQFASEPAEDLVVATVEVAANGLRHGAPPVRVRAWHHHDTLIVECDDSAGRPIPATAGYQRPQPADPTPGGRGLWVARQLADVVQIHSTSNRTCVRLLFPQHTSCTPTV
ncbi:ATP-binding protein [Paractinoplanes rishiriensis]|nr:ATP-binding protein [Actinoplanes rishiriensis]